MVEDRERTYLESAPLGRLATADVDGRPHAVPVCFALVDAEASSEAAADAGGVRVVTPIDEKPQRVDPTDLRRVRDIEANPRVALVVDHWAEEWADLGWVQIRGTATVHDPPAEGDGPPAGNDETTGGDGESPGTDDEATDDRDGPTGEDDETTDGTASIHARAVAALRDKYDQYDAHDLESRPVIAIEPGSVRSWGRLERPKDAGRDLDGA